MREMYRRVNQPKFVTYITVRGLRPLTVIRLVGQELDDVSFPSQGELGRLSHSPPSTTRIEPVIQSPAGDAKYATMLPISAGVPQRPRGILRRACSSITVSTAGPPAGWVNALRTPSVGMGPGAVAFTRIFAGAHSTASVRVRASTPALAAVACAICGQPR